MVVVIAKDNNGDSDCNDSGVVLGEKKKQKVRVGTVAKRGEGKRTKKVCENGTMGNQVIANIWQYQQNFLIVAIVVPFLMTLF